MRANSSSRLAGRLQKDFPNAWLEFVDRLRAFVPEDRPERLAEIIAGSLSELANARVSGVVVLAGDG